MDAIMTPVYGPVESQPRIRETKLHAKKNGRVRVAVADHQHLARHALRCLVEESDRFTVVSEIDDSGKVESTIARLRPDVLLVDFEMAPLNGPDVARVVRQRAPGTAVVVVSRSINETHAVQSLRNGAAAYVTKVAPPRELVQAIDAAVKGERFVSSPFSRRPVDYWVKRAERGVADTYETLSTRERQILHLVSTGLSSTAIARRLGISRRTVESHRENVKAKLGIRNHAGLIRYAVERQLSGLSEPARRSSDRPRQD